MRDGAQVLESDPFGEKVLRLSDGAMLKLFRRKRLISSAAWSPYAQRFADNAVTLATLGIPVPQVLAVFRIPHIGRDAVHYRPLAGVTLRDLLRQGMDRHLEQRLRALFTRFVIDLHDKGIYFRSLHLGNVVYTPEETLGLIDFSDVRAWKRPLIRYLRARNLRRMQGIPGEADWLDLEAILGAGVTAPR